MNLVKEYYKKKKKRRTQSTISLRMLIFGNVQKEGNPIGAFFAAHVACEDIVVAMVAHVNGVQDGVLE